MFGLLINRIVGFYIFFKNVDKRTVYILSRTTKCCLISPNLPESAIELLAGTYYHN